MEIKRNWTVRRFMLLRQTCKWDLRIDTATRNCFLVDSMTHEFAQYETLVFLLKHKYHRHQSMICSETFAVVGTGGAVRDSLMRSKNTKDKLKTLYAFFPPR